MVAKCSLIQGLIVETLRLGVSIWGQDSASDWKEAIRDHQGHCELRRAFLEAEARNCSERLNALAGCGAEVEVCREQLRKWRSAVNARHSSWECSAGVLRCLGLPAWS